MANYWTKGAAALGLALACWSCQPAGTAGSGDAITLAAVDGEFLASGGDGSQWAMAGFSYDEKRFSPLKLINDGNVGDLGIAWFADLPDARGQEATPLMVDGKLFVTTAWSKVMAFDARTGEPLWSFDPEVPKAKGVQACCDVVNRGPALWKGKLYVGTLDGRLIALDAQTGRQIWSVQTTDNSKPYTITGVPRVVKDMVVIGNGGAEFGVRGYVTAYDAATGKQRWRFYTTPNPAGEPDGAASDKVMATASRTWSQDGGEWRESGGGGTVWDAIVYDHELDQLYLGVGNGNPWNHGLRSNGEGDNLFLSSIVALKPDTGEYLWHYQETPAETWDFTATQPIILADLPVGGDAAGAGTATASLAAAGDGGKAPASRKVLLHAPKNGFFFVIDRRDGKLVSATPFVDGITWASGYDMKTGRPIENPEARFYKTGKPFVAMPSALGAHNWHPMSFNPGTGLVYIPANQIAAAYLAPQDELEGARKPIGFNTGGSNEGFAMPDDRAQMKAAIAATKGRLVAFDPVAKKVAWAVDHPTPWNGGTLTTAGNLVFQGTALGQMRAYAADSGRQLASFDVQSGVLSGPSTYMLDGEQYVAFLTSKGGAFPLVAGIAGGAANPVPNIPRLVVMKLGGTAKLPALPAPTPLAWDPPARIGTAAQVATGRAHYLRYCMVCHGDGAVGGGVVPDLRRSGALASPEAWDAILRNGALAENGMISFAPVMDKDKTDAIRAYVIDRAHFARTLAEEEKAAGGARKVAAR